jgi:hypothetical protein
MDRTPRTADTREKETRRKPWAPPSTLEAPPAPEGFQHRWIRASSGTIAQRRAPSCREY